METLNNQKDGKDIVSEKKKEKGNIFTCQFHPEKSAINGIQIFKNFYEFAKKWKEVKSLR